MRVSIVNCVSTAYEMMKFSDRSLVTNAGNANFDYVVVTWLPSPEIKEYLRQLPSIIRSLCAGTEDAINLHIVEHTTDESVGYVPNLRAMMNRGFDYGFGLNSYAGLVNTDCYFGHDWLKNLVKHVDAHRVVNSIHITPSKPPKPVEGIKYGNFGIPEEDKFNAEAFFQLHDLLHKDNLYIAPKNDHRQAATMPYLFHREYWKRCGPWELTLKNGTPDMNFFQRVSDAGAEFVLAQDSIVYHHEAVERRGSRPEGTTHLEEE